MSEFFWISQNYLKHLCLWIWRNQAKFPWDIESKFPRLELTQYRCSDGSTPGHSHRCCHDQAVKPAGGDLNVNRYPSFLKQLLLLLPLPCPRWDNRHCFTMMTDLLLKIHRDAECLTSEVILKIGQFHSRPSIMKTACEATRWSHNNSVIIGSVGEAFCCRI